MQQTEVLILDQVSLCALLRSPQFSGNRGVGDGLPLSAENPEDAQRLKVRPTESRDATSNGTETVNRQKRSSKRTRAKEDQKQQVKRSSNEVTK